MSGCGRGCRSREWQGLGQKANGREGEGDAVWLPWHGVGGSDSGDGGHFYDRETQLGGHIADDISLLCGVKRRHMLP